MWRAQQVASSRRALLPLWLAVAVVVLLAFDALTPAGFSHGTLYLPLVLVAALAGGVGLVRAVALAAGVMVVLGGALTHLVHSAADGSVIAANRSMSIVALVITTYLAEWLARSRLKASRTAEELRREKATAEEQHRLLALAGEISHFGGWSLDVPAGRLVWSDEVAAVHDEAPGTSPTLAELGEHYPPADRARLLEAIDRCVRAGERFDLELALSPRADGARRWVSANGRAVQDASGRVLHVQGSFQDITARKEAEEAAASHRRRLRFVADAMPLIVWGAEPDGRLTYFNQSFEDYTGRDRRTMAGDAWLEVVHPDDRDTTMATWRASVASEVPYETEFRIRGRDGLHRWHLVMALPERDEQDQVVAWWGSAADVHEHRRLESEARELAHRLAGTLESITDGVLSLDAEWRFTFVNDNAEQILGQSRQELVLADFWETYPAAVGTVFEESYRAAVAERRTVRFQAYYPPHEAWYEVNAYPHAEGLTIFFRDVTEQRLLSERYAQAQRMESLGQLTGGVAHDFNNLLTIVLGNAESLALQLDPADHRRELATMIVDCAERGADLTQNLLAFARRQPLEPTAVDVNELLTGAEGLLRRTLGGDIALAYDLEPGLPSCRADPGELESALLNLCLNARDAMAAGGRVVVGTSCVELGADDLALQPDAAPGRYVRVTVSDSGHGIAARDLGRVLEPFFSTKPFGKGSGLGLPRVHGFVKQSRGHLTIESEPGIGTTVALHLPLLADSDPAVAPAGAPAVAPDPAGVPDPPGAVGPPEGPVGAVAGPGPGVWSGTPGGSPGATVLLVEDDAEVRQSVTLRLEALGYDVVEAAAGHEALGVLSTDAPVDLLLTDVMLAGGINGPQLCERAEELRPGLPVLFTSGYADDELVLDGRFGPGVRLLAKPYTNDTLAAAVATTLAESAAPGEAT